MNDSTKTERGGAEATPYEQLGGAERVRALVERFYDLIEHEPAYAVIRRLHGPDLGDTRDKLYWYLSGWLGGPNLYIERFGHPMLRARHLPFSIGISERDAWLGCMKQAMQETQVPVALQEALAGAFSRTADWMRNRPE
jgi:hemoglobin